MTETYELTCALINKKSVTPEDGGTLQLILDHLGTGVKFEWLNFGDTKNLYVTHGSGVPHLMYLGHVDVVPSGDPAAWTYPPFEANIRDNKLFGRGACDMKSGVAAMTVAYKNFISSNPTHSGTLSLLLTSDEEGTNLNAIPKVVEEFKKRNLKIDYCIVGEPSSSLKLADTIKVGRRGTLNGTVVIRGIQGHTAYPQLADNPIHNFAPILTRLAQHRWDQGHESFEPTSLQFSNINAGTGATNVIPGELKAQFNIRFSTLHSPQSLMEKVEDFFKDQNIKYELSWAIGGLPFLTNQGKLIECVQACVNSQFGYSCSLETGGGTSDARFIAPLGTEVIELGVRGDSLHKVNEFVRIEELEPLAKLYQKISHGLLGN